MKITLEQGHAALPAAPVLEVALLLTVEPDGTAGVGAPVPTHVAFCLDRSGSMDEASGVSGLSKLDALKAATQGALQRLAAHSAATVTLGAFSSSTDMLATGVAVDARSAAQLAQEVEQLAAGDSTRAHPCIEACNAALARTSGHARRLVLVTDGHFNSDSVKPSRKAVSTAGDTGVVAWVFGTGVNYAEEYLRELAALGAPGSMFMHVSDLGRLQATLDAELDASLRAGATGLEMQLRAGSGVEILDALRLVPMQAAVNAGRNSCVDRVDVVDARGQAWVIRLRVHNAAQGHLVLADVDLSWNFGGRRETQRRQAALNVLPAGSAVAAPAARVANTVLVSQAAQQTLLGNAALATQLYAAAGQTQMAQGLGALGTALQGGTDAARSARTQALGNTRLVALGTAAPVRGGTP